MAISTTIAGLLPGTLYHFRLVAENTQGDIHGTDETFTTAPAPCVSQTPAASSATVTGLRPTGATLTAAVDSSCGKTTYFFQYGRTTSYGSATAPQSESSLVPANVVAPIADLFPHTRYHFRVVAENATGTAVGTDGTFVTLIRKPIEFVHAPRRVRYRARFVLTIKLRTKATVSISLLSRGVVIKRLPEGARAGTFHPRILPVRVAGKYVIRVFAVGGGTSQAATARVTVFKPHGA